MTIKYASSTMSGAGGDALTVANPMVNTTGVTAEQVTKNYQDYLNKPVGSVLGTTNQSYGTGDSSPEAIAWRKKQVELGLARDPNDKTGMGVTDGVNTSGQNLTQAEQDEKAIRDADAANLAAIEAQGATPEDIANATKKYQAEIDALNGVYAEQRRQLALTGEGRLGTTASIQARRGLLGSDFGTAQTEDINQLNTAEADAAAAKHAQNIAAVTEKVNKAAQDEAALRLKSATEGADARINEIKGRQTRKQTAIDTAAQQIIDSGIDPTKITEEELIKMADSSGIFGISKNDIMSAYKTRKTAADKITLENQKVNADLTAPKDIGDHTWIFNPKTNAWEDKGLNTKPVAGQTVAGNLGTYTVGANPTVDAWANRIQNGSAKITDIPATEKALRNAVTVALDAMGNSTEGKPTTTELGKAALVNAKGLMKKLTDRVGTGAVGGSRFFGGGLLDAIPGTNRSNFVNDFNAIKAQLSLEGVKYLKGQGQVSDAERTLLAQAVTKLNLSQSEDEFNTTLQSIIDKLEGNVPKNTVTPPVNEVKIVDDNTKVVNGKTYQKVEGGWQLKQ